jgi:hypothetical protein
MRSTSSKEYCVGLRTSVGVFVARYAHPCVSEEGKPVVRRGRKGGEGADAATYRTQRSETSASPI